ncbi:hypothetical protein AVEN_147987-1 [Araneus ventricosus]|uniref:Uncharacterized protein n=1 Tax=Araneus ventricosus TaxID=182803 RepID=A0A4Y2H8R5_ARAVE|nr:hypothetical protein AVEN_147987-1 [Araneus ventricosus]
MPSVRILYLRTVETDQDDFYLTIRVRERDYPSRICFSPVVRKYFRREQFTRGGRRNSTSLFRKQVRHLIAEDSNMGVNPLNANSAFL